MIDFGILNLPYAMEKSGWGVGLGAKVWDFRYSRLC